MRRPGTISPAGLSRSENTEENVLERLRKLMDDLGRLFPPYPPPTHCATCGKPIPAERYGFYYCSSECVPPASVAGL